MIHWVHAGEDADPRVAAKYRLEVWAYESFFVVLDPVIVNSVSCTPTKAYDTLDKFYWRAQMIGRDNRVGPLIEPVPGEQAYGHRMYMPLVWR